MAWSSQGWRWRGFAPIRSNAIALGNVVGSLQLSGLKPRRQMPELRRRRRYGKRRRRNPCRRRHLRHCVIVAHRARVALKRYDAACCFKYRPCPGSCTDRRASQNAPEAGPRPSRSTPAHPFFPYHLPPPPISFFYKLL